MPRDTAPEPRRDTLSEPRFPAAYAALRKARADGVGDYVLAKLERSCELAAMADGQDRAHRALEATGGNKGRALALMLQERGL